MPSEYRAPYEEAPTRPHYGYGAGDGDDAGEAEKLLSSSTMSNGKAENRLLVAWQRGSQHALNLRKVYISILIAYSLFLTALICRDRESISSASREELKLYPTGADQITPHYKGARVGQITLMVGSGSRWRKRGVDDSVRTQSMLQNATAFELALEVRKRYCERWKYPLWVATRGLLYGPEPDPSKMTPIYSKQAMLLSVVLDELRKPVNERLEWIFFFDADTLLVNHNIPLETFLPPDNDFGRSQLLLMARDPWGTINGGCIAIRVHENAIKFLSGAIALPTIIGPYRRWQNGEQTAMIEVIGSDVISPHITLVPAFWFNADSFSLFDPHKFNSRWPPSYQYGDFMIHFMDRPKVNFTEMSRTVLAGTNASLSIPLNETRYIKGDENVANWYEKQAKIPLADRQAMARMGGIGPLYKHE